MTIPSPRLVSATMFAAAYPSCVIPTQEGSWRNDHACLATSRFRTNTWDKTCSARRSQLAIAIGLILSLSSLESVFGIAPAASGLAAALMDSSASGDSHKDRAAMPEIFIGRAVEHDGEGFGNFPIANDAEKMELIFRFEKWIAKAERHERRNPYGTTEFCEAPALNPMFDLQPSQGPAGAAVRLTATGLVRPAVAIWWAGFASRLGEAEVDEDCTMTAQIVIPPDANPGLYQVLIIGVRQVQSQGMFRVTD